MSPIQEGSKKRGASERMLVAPSFKRKIEILDSEWILFVEYDPETLILDLTTRSGDRYRYRKLGTDTFAKLVTAESSGSYFNAEIKGKLQSVKLKRA